MAGERGRDWVSVAIGLVIVGIVTAALWNLLDGSFPSGNVGGGIGAGWLVAISAAVILLLVLVTRLSRSRRSPRQGPTVSWGLLLRPRPVSGPLWL